MQAATRDELGTLAEAFNEMTHGLLLKETYRGVLDKVVSREIADELLKGEITLGGETRRVATLFADVRGFTAFSEGMEPQRVISLLNEMMQRASDAIDAEGGVVDKYVGDAVMAVFGAPMSRGADAERAVRAALRIRESLDALNAERVRQGEAPLGMGIGINVGPAVAGNMGSTGRLNYTVLGESVNVASRLCDVAAAGEILETEAVLRDAGPAVDATLQGPRPFKGLSAPLDVYTVHAIRTDVTQSSSSETAAAARAVASALALLAALAAPQAARAQGLPTLQELGVSWSSPGGTFQVTPSGRIDLEGYVPGDVSRSLIESTDPFVAGRASLFLDLFAGKRVYGLVEGRLDRGEAPQDRPVQARIEQAYVRLTPIPAANLSLQAGKFVSPFGNYPQRHHTSGDPFIRPPLSYDYRTMVAPGWAPLRPSGFAGWKDAPQIFRPIGAPPVWGAPYQVGAMVMGAFKGLGFRVAMMNSAPSSEPEEWNRIRQNYRYSFVAHAALQVTPELKVGVSYDKGRRGVRAREDGRRLPADAVGLRGGAGARSGGAARRAAAGHLGRAAPGGPVPPRRVVLRRGEGEAHAGPVRGLPLQRHPLQPDHAGERRQGGLGLPARPDAVRRGVSAQPQHRGARRVHAHHRHRPPGPRLRRPVRGSLDLAVLNR